MKEPRQAVILAGGLGTRLRPLTEAIPKPLLPVGEKAVLEVQILQLKKHGFTDIYLATNYKSDYIESFFGSGERLGVRLTVSKEKEPLGTCGPITLLRHRLNRPFLVMNGDILTTADFGRIYERALGTDSDFTVVTKEIVTPFAFGRIHCDGDFIVNVEEKPDIRAEIVAGIYVMKPSIFDIVPVGQYFGIDDLIKKMLVEGRPVAKHETRSVWLDIGQPPDYQRAQELYATHFAPEDEVRELQNPAV